MPKSLGDTYRQSRDGFYGRIHEDLAREARRKGDPIESKAQWENASRFYKSAGDSERQQRATQQSEYEQKAISRGPAPYRGSGGGLDCCIIL